MYVAFRAGMNVVYFQRVVHPNVHAMLLKFGNLLLEETSISVEKIVCRRRRVGVLLLL